MRAWIGLALMALVAACASPSAAQPAQAWPDGRRAAIVLTYDDALVSQLEHAVPALDAAGLKGTFFLQGRSSGMIVDRWRAAAASGHELANHSVNHPCMRGSFEMPEQYMNENWTVASMLADVQVMERLLEAIDGKTRHAYGTPCGQNLVGGADYVAPLLASGMVGYVRDMRAPYPENAPPVSAMGFTDVTGAQMIEWVEGVRRAGGLGIIVFHGVGGDHLSVSAEAHRELVAHLKAHEREIWTTTFTEAMDHVNGVD